MEFWEPRNKMGERMTDVDHLELLLMGKPTWVPAAPPRSRQAALLHVARQVEAARGAQRQCERAGGAGQGRELQRGVQKLAGADRTGAEARGVGVQGAGPWALAGAFCAEGA